MLDKLVAEHPDYAGDQRVKSLRYWFGTQMDKYMARGIGLTTEWYKDGSSSTQGRMLFLLLNIGPRADGTRPWRVAQEGPTKTLEGAFTDAKRQAFTSMDYRFSAKGDAVYATVLERPQEGSVLIRALATNATYGAAKVREVSILGGSAKAAFRHDGLGLRVDSPDLARGSGPAVVKITRG